MKQKILLLISLISFIYGWTVDTEYQCRCEALIEQSECSQGNCIWSSFNTCQSIDCQILNQTECYQYQDLCAYDPFWRSCGGFGFCQQLIGNSPQNCSIQNPTCTWQSGDYCISPSDCEYFNLTNCPQTCYTNGFECLSYMNCDQLNQTLCATQNLCAWNATNGYCLSAPCSSFLSYESCLFSQSYGYLVQPCLWQSGACVNALSEEVYDLQTCFTHTAQTYHWALKVNSTSDYYCKSCNQFLFTIQIVLIVLFQ